jgi:hypothetical protein
VPRPRPCANLGISPEHEVSAMTMELLSEQERTRIERARQREEDRLRMLELAQRLRTVDAGR